AHGIQKGRLFALLRESALGSADRDDLRAGVGRGGEEQAAAVRRGSEGACDAVSGRLLEALPRSRKPVPKRSVGRAGHTAGSRRTGGVLLCFEARALVQRCSECVGANLSPRAADPRTTRA